MAETTKLRTTFTPGVVLEVEASELLDLERGGLIYSREGDDNWEDGEAEDITSGELTPEPDAKATKADNKATADKVEAPGALAGKDAE